jgi:hypothetical protein
MFDRTLGSFIPTLHDFTPPPSPDGGVVDVPVPGAAGIDQNNAIPIAGESDYNSLPSGAFFVWNGEIGQKP